MNKTTFQDGSFLFTFNDDQPWVRSFLVMKGIPVAETELKAAQCKIPVCLAYTTPFGSVFYHYGLLNTANNGWSCALANKPDSMASKAASVMAGQIKKDDMSTIELGEAE